MTLHRSLLRLLLLVGLLAAGLVLPSASPASAGYSYVNVSLPANTSNVVRKQRLGISCVSSGKTYYYYAEAETVFSRVGTTSLTVDRITMRYYIPNNVVKFHVGRQGLTNSATVVNHEIRRDYSNPSWNGSNSYVGGYTITYNKTFTGGQTNGKANVLLNIPTAACGSLNYMDWNYYVA